MTGTITRIDHAALFAVISSLADNKQAMGRRYAYWCNGAPALEAAVAAAAMTQDELGHARTLYPLLDNFTQAEADPQQIEPETRTLRAHLAFLDREFQGWSDFVATNFLLDGALTVFFESALNSSYEPLRQRARKIVEEERIHTVHGEGWVRRLARMGGAVRASLVESLQRLWNETFCWFGPEDDQTMQCLYSEAIVDATPGELRSRLLHKIAPTMNGQELPLPANFYKATGSWELPQPLPWARWNAVSRRLE